MANKQLSNNNLFGIIGLGRFGASVAKELKRNNKEVICLETDENVAKSYRDDFQNLYLVDQTSKATLQEAGIQNCSTVIIAIGKDIEASILITLNVIELGVPNVISKANSTDHGKVLEKIGAKVIFPEVEMGKRLAMSLSNANTLEFLKLSGNFSIAEVELPETFKIQTIRESDFRNKYQVNIIAIIRNEKVIGDISPNTKLIPKDNVVVSGETKAVTEFTKKNK
ncbi:MAG: TrkA family potassium uptake protein [Sphaerochaetaceae bacterium]|nr:TrkA family potassium uptake protein [Sphaerochaetaceae bacterium]